MAQYNTLQRQILIEFMTKNKNKSLSVDEWVSLMNYEIIDTKPPARSTVYRLMQRLVKENLIIQSISQKSITYCIANCSNTNKHLHLKCITCGNISHVDNKMSHNLSNKILKQYDFEINLVDTIVYGKCTKCN